MCVLWAADGQLGHIVDSGKQNWLVLLTVYAGAVVLTHHHAMQAAQSCKHQS